MKFFKKTLITVIFCTTVCIDAKISGGAPAPSPKPAPAPVAQQKPAPAPIRQPTPQPQAQPKAQTPTFQSLIAYVKSTPSAWDRPNARLSTKFVDDMIQQARTAQLDASQLETLLQTARDMHGIFFGNQQKDIAILQSVDNQITNATNNL